MRWLVAHPGPQFSVQDMYTGWVEALTALGEEVAEYNLDRRLQFYDAALLETGEFDDDGHPQVKKALTQEQAISLAAGGLMNAAYHFWPDVILLISAFFTPPALLDVMAARGHKIVLVHSESPYQESEQLARAAHAHVNLLNDPANIDAYKALNLPVAYMPHAYRPHIHYPGPGEPQLECDLAFVGTAYESRIAFFEAMDLDDLDVILAGNWKPAPETSPLRAHVAHEIDNSIDNDRTAVIYRSARAGINFYRREAEDAHAGEGWAMGPREVEQAACGLFFLRDPRGEGDEVLPMLPTFASPEEAGDKLRFFLAHDNLRWAAAREARAAIADRTFDSNARKLLRLLDRQPVRM